MHLLVHHSPLAQLSTGHEYFYPLTAHPEQSKSVTTSQLCWLHRIGMQATHGCGDLVFSSHTIFALTGMMVYSEYGTYVATKVRHSA